MTNLCPCFSTQRCAYGCGDAVLAKLLSKSRLRKCLFLRNTQDKPKMMNYNFRATAFQLHLHGNQKLGKETSKTVDLFYFMNQRYNPNQNQGVRMGDHPIAEKLLHLNTFS